MDTKLKKSRILRIILGLAAVLLAVVVNLNTVPEIAHEAEGWLAQNDDTQEMYQQEVYSEILTPIYYGSYILALENDNAYGELNNQSLLQEWHAQFDNIRDRVDYYVTNSDGSRTSSNNSNNLGGVLLTEEISRQKVDQITGLYSACFCLCFDGEGILTVESIFEEPGQGDWILKRLQSIDRENQNLTQDVYDKYTMDWKAEEVERPKDLTIVWGIPKEYMNTFSSEAEYSRYWERISAYQHHGAELLYFGSLAALLLAAALLTSKRIWRERISYRRISVCYGAEAAVAAVIWVVSYSWDFAAWINYYAHSFEGQLDPIYIVMREDVSQILTLLVFGGTLAVIYGVWYLALLLLRPVCSLGIRQYVKEYSLIYLIAVKCGGWCRRKWRKLKEEIRQIDFDAKGMRAIRKVVILNFAVLAVISCFWVVGIPILAVYSAAVFFLVKRQYDLARGDYGKLLAAASRMAEGDLNAIEESQEWGMFEPIKGELEKIRVGFGKAVDEEVKSQRMKTELITNVSHDLKTPLTAITTYVELLKNPDITPEERASYIDTLERKALRLKALIEDLFEISKATSNSIRLELMEVDVVNLIKQVSVEHTDKFEAKGLELRWQLPEKAVCTLDSQKTYRIFENLFVNIEKYAMDNSRVYIEVSQEESGKASSGQPGEGERKTKIVLKNMSAAELNVRPEELTERFVRGDDSRNTEGSGLGLAIVRSFTEAQGGSFRVEVDGDLFKAVIEM